VRVRADAPAAAAPAAAAAPGAAKPAGGVETSMTYFKPVLDIEAIKGVLPHRWAGAAALCVGCVSRARHHN
jgi:hypothetical protein